MTPDWTLVALEHVVLACEMYDSGVAQPKHPAQSTFLVLNGKTYPGKFVRGLAYRLATGIKLDPNRDYAGGIETIRFFEKLGLTTRHDSLSSQKKSPTATRTPTIPAPAAAGSDHQLDALLGTAQVEPEVLTVPAKSPSGLSNKIRRIALVSHDYNVLDSRGLIDYSEHFDRINRRCDDQGCDTILYALYTWDRASPVPRNHASFFDGLYHVQRIILEVGQPTIDSFDHVEVWQRGRQTPMVVHQRFVQAGDSNSRKRQFIEDLPARMIGNCLLVLCGESGIVSQNRTGGFTDAFEFLDHLNRMGVAVILNPIHDYMARSHNVDMRDKRLHYSSCRRTVVSVWNQGNGRDEYVEVPWTVFHDGTDRTNAVRELSRPFSDRSDIRIGIADLD